MLPENIGTGFFNRLPVGALRYVRLGLAPILIALLIPGGVLANELDGGAAALPDRFVFANNHVFAKFQVRQLGLFNIHGQFHRVVGEVVFAGSDRDGRIVVGVETASIDTDDIERDLDLRSGDFFNTREFPQMTFIGAGIERTGDTTGRGRGTLTLLGVSRPVVLEVTFNRCDSTAVDKACLLGGFTASVSVRRSDFGMTRLIPLIGDEVSFVLVGCAHPGGSHRKGNPQTASVP